MLKHNHDNKVLGKVIFIPQLVKIRKTNYMDFNMSLNSFADIRKGEMGS